MLRENGRAFSVGAGVKTVVGNREIGKGRLFNDFPSTLLLTVPSESSFLMKRYLYQVLDQDANQCWQHWRNQPSKPTHTLPGTPSSNSHTYSPDIANSSPPVPGSPFHRRHR